MINNLFYNGLLLCAIRGLLWMMLITTKQNKKYCSWNATVLYYTLIGLYGMLSFCNMTDSSMQ